MEQNELAPRDYSARRCMIEMTNFYVHWYPNQTSIRTLFLHMAVLYGHSMDL